MNNKIAAVVNYTPGELTIIITSASSQKYLPSVATVVYNDFYSYHNTYTTSRNSHG